MAHAYETFAEDGKLTYGTMSPAPGSRHLPPGPVGIDEIGRGSGKDFKPLEQNGTKLVNHVRTRRVLTPQVAGTVGSILKTVVTAGTATRAQVPGVTIAGKTGTTEGFGDAWFVGWTKEFTIAIWVGYPDSSREMKTEFQGQSVAGGTFPAGIFKTFVESLVSMKLVKKDEPSLLPVPSPVPGSSGAAGTTTAPAAAATPQSSGAAPSAPTPAAQQQATPAPTQAAPAPSSGAQAAPTPSG
jgi:penicillin-binding protein 1A